MGQFFVLFSTERVLVWKCYTIIRVLQVYFRCISGFRNTIHIHGGIIHVLSEGAELYMQDVHKNCSGLYMCFCYFETASACSIQSAFILVLFPEVSRILIVWVRQKKNAVMTIAQVYY